MTPQFTLRKNERLKSRKLINCLFEKGNSFHNGPFRVYFLTSQDIASPVQFGVSVGKRHFKKSVDRNRIKRLIRESYRLQKLGLYELMNTKQQHISLFIVYTSKEMLTYHNIYTAMEKALDELMKRLGK